MAIIGGLRISSWNMIGEWWFLSLGSELSEIGKSPWYWVRWREQLLHWLVIWGQELSFGGVLECCDSVCKFARIRMKLTPSSDSRKSEQQRKGEHNSYFMEQTPSQMQQCKIVSKEE
jgi:hypothetical protein